MDRLAMSAASDVGRGKSSALARNLAAAVPVNR